jgi:FMN reductase
MTTPADPPVTVLGVVASPHSSARTATAVQAVLGGATAAGARTSQLAVAGEDRDVVLQAMSEADAVVFGSPTYRASYTSLLKELLEGTERGRYGETSAPLRGTAAAIVLTGATPHHFLAGDGLRSVLAGFFAVQVLSPGLYLDHAAYTGGGDLAEPGAALADLHGRALVDLAVAVRFSAALQGLGPQV